MYYLKFLFIVILPVHNTITGIIEGYFFDWFDYCCNFVWRDSVSLACLTKTFAVKMIETSILFKECKTELPCAFPHTEFKPRSYC